MQVSNDSYLNILKSGVKEGKLYGQLAGLAAAGVLITTSIVAVAVVGGTIFLPAKVSGQMLMHTYCKLPDSIQAPVSRAADAVAKSSPVQGFCRLANRAYDAVAPSNVRVTSTVECKFNRE